MSMPSTDACSKSRQPMLATGLPWLWATADSWADMLAGMPDSNLDPKLAKFLKWDPGYVSQHLWSDAQHASSTNSGVPESLWDLKSSRELSAVTKLFQSGLAIGLAIERHAEECSFELPWTGLAWSIWLQGPLWLIAAKSPRDFADWCDASESSVKHQIETKILGLRATLWSQWNLAQNRQDELARFLWTSRGNFATEITSSHSKSLDDKGLLSILEQAHVIYSQSRYALQRGHRSETSMKDPRVALLEAKVANLSNELTLSPPEDTRLVKRTISLIHSAHHTQAIQSRLDQASLILQTISRDSETLLKTSKNSVKPAQSTPIKGSSDPIGGAEGTDFQVVQQQWSQLQTHWWELLGRLDDWSEEMGKNHRRSESQAQAGRFESLAEFAAGAGHELNNPLAVIQGRAQLLLAKAADETTRLSLKAIIDQSLRAHRMLRDLIFIARPTDLRPRFCRPAEVVRAIHRELKEDLHRREIRFEVQICPLAQRYETDQFDPDAFRHMILSLVRNAMEASPRGGQIQVSLKLEQHGLRLTVEDDGQGFDVRESSHLFDPFYCGRKAGRGLGLGLPRLARIVAQMNGRVRYRSQPDRGSVFEAVLPVYEPELQALSTPA